jgi:hypothetical protein
MFLLPALLAGRPAGGLTSTFLQWWASHRDWEESRWVALFGYLRQLGVEELVVQWTRYDDLDFTPLLERTLAMAEDHRMRVWVGLAQESTWWRDVEGGPGAALETLRRVGAQCSGQGRALMALCRRRKAFRGWYLPFEFEDENWNEASIVGVQGELRRLRRELRPLAVSGFTNRRLGPAVLARWWRAVARGGVDEVFFQDGIGAGKMTLDLWPAYLRALEDALGKRLRVVVELFESAGEQMGPAPVERIQHQVELARRLSRGHLAAFSMPEYLTPLGGPGAARNFQQYLDFHSISLSSRR